MKKVIFYNDANNVGGHEILALKAIENIVNKNIEVVCIISEKNNSFYEMLEKIKNIKIIRIKYVSSRLQIVMNILNLKLLLNLVFKIKKINPDLIIAVQGTIEISSSILIPSKLLKKTIVSYIPITYKIKEVSRNKILSSIKDCINYFYFKIPDFYITINEGMKENIIERGIKNEKVYIAKNGIDFSKYNKIEKKIAREILKLPQEKYIYGMIGRVEFNHKGHDLLIEMVSKYKQYFDNVIFLIVGNGSDKQKMIDLVDEKKLNNYFVFKEHIIDTSEIYSAIDCIIIPSRYEAYEGTPLVLYEALFFKLKVCATNLKGIKGFLPEKWIFEKENIDSMFSTISNIKLLDKEKLDIERLHKYIKNEFNIDEFKKNFYSSILDIEEKKYEIK